MTAATQPRETISDVMKQFGQPGTLPDLTETVRQVESVKSVKFAFHPWLPISNFGSDGFRFNIPYAVLERLTLIPLAVFRYPRITPRGGQFAFGLSTLGVDPTGFSTAFEVGAVPAMGSQNKVETLMQMPSVSMNALYTAYSKFGMVELEALASHDEAKLSENFILFNAVMGLARCDEEGNELEQDLEAGLRSKHFTLEDLLKPSPDLMDPRHSRSISWLETGAPRALRAALKGVSIKGQRYAIAQSQIASGEKLIEQLKQSVYRAHQAALNPADGILPRTKELLNITANKGTGGKTHLDNQDSWLLSEYPSFKMDTDVERAQKAMQGAIEAGNQTNDEFKTGVMAILQQQQQTMDLLARHLVAGKEEKKPASPTRNPKPE